jgi:hypothetical protein
MMITLCFYLEQQGATDAVPGPNLTEWLALKAEFGCELASIHWKHTVENAQTAQVDQYPSPMQVYSNNPEATHVFISEGAETEFADLPTPPGDVVYYIGRNSHGFRNDLIDFEGLTFANLPGGDLWAHEAARAVLET